MSFSALSSRFERYKLTLWHCCVQQLRSIRWWTWLEVNNAVW